ncbi:DUF7059 domain-containing protein [Dermatophilus congolensis]|uniref:DUF7059 domain-containing protein n=1 Tax=Dermatophilus congolensis TaxID=1863 RepID=UPI001AAED442|nr:methyltransferase [Dermatophilus congolensis]MBO3130659.1 methyltransferase [Dermatophilus congolensis]MBO3130711.1 methyltransferase [Dermatophilus congolensis]MBO3135132.1 methyltransferase [Dermatophilus congolensis]MBO3137371.1 methyltransferase [Dermatophilus congolensis]MBO3139612.1 methyltransferase [Dermatophilus congolensis]
MSFVPPVVVPELVAALRADLLACDFTVEGVESYLGTMASAALRRGEVLPAELKTRECGGATGVVVRLFTLGMEVDFAEVDAALPSVGGDGLLRLGLVRRAGAALQAGVDLRPYGDEENVWWVVSDVTGALGSGPLATDHVVGVGGASVTLAQWTSRPRVGRALDLGTGSGVQALHLGAHADEVVVTDVSERALAFARFTAALAGVEWDVRCGSLFEPVEGERFDLVVCNPPYVITPRVAGVPVFEYRDGGLAGDSVMKTLVGQVGDFLNPGGVAHFIGNWEIPQGQVWSDRLQEWLAGTGLDAWVVQRDVQDPAEYASTWARDGGLVPGSYQYESLYSAWLEDFAQRGVEGIGFGVVMLARSVREREPFRDLVEVRGPVSLPMGESVRDGLAVRARLAELDDEALLEVRLKVAGDVTIEKHMLPGCGDPAAIVVRQGGSLRRALGVSPQVCAVVDVADGDLTLRQSLVAIAALMDESVEQVCSEALPVVRELVAGGFLRLS